MSREIAPKMLALQESIQWSGMVRLHQLGEDSESKLAALEWPPKSGKTYYACASTGLLFDQQSGQCQQSSSVELLMDTVKPEKCTPSQFAKWVSSRQTGNMKHLQLKRGPKPKGQRSVIEQEYDDAFYD